MRKPKALDDGRRLWEQLPDDVPSTQPRKFSSKKRTIHKAPESIVIPCTSILRQYSNDPQASLTVEFYPYAGFRNSVRQKGSHFRLRFSDVMGNAPPEVFTSAAHILFARIHGRRCSRKNAQPYEDYARSDATHEAARTVRKERRRVPRARTQGRFYDLDEAFDRINRKYFNDALSRPELSWSPNKARSHLAHHDGQINRIVVSRLFDDKRVPLYVLDYLVFHETLHIVYPTIVRNGRRVIHSAEFRKAELRYRQYQEAVQWLEKNL